MCTRTLANCADASAVVLRFASVTQTHNTAASCLQLCAAEALQSRLAGEVLGVEGKRKHAEPVDLGQPVQCDVHEHRRARTPEVVSHCLGVDVALRKNRGDVDVEVTELAGPVVARLVGQRALVRKGKGLGVKGVDGDAEPLIQAKIQRDRPSNLMTVNK